MPIDPEMEKLLEEYEDAKKRLEIRAPLIDEAVAEIDNREVDEMGRPRPKFVTISDYIGFGRMLRLTEGVKAALLASAEEEKADLAQAVETARAAVMERRALMVGP